MGRPRVKIENGMKVCPKCKQNLPLDTKHYNKSSVNWYGFQTYCRGCLGIYTDRTQYNGHVNQVSMHNRRYTVKGIEKFSFSNRQCEFCGLALDFKSFKLRFDRPLARGGEDSWSNTVVLCPDCARRKGLRTLEEWRNHESQTTQLAQQ